MINAADDSIVDRYLYEYSQVQTALRRDPSLQTHIDIAYEKSTELLAAAAKRHEDYQIELWLESKTSAERGAYLKTLIKPPTSKPS